VVDEGSTVSPVKPVDIEVFAEFHDSGATVRPRLTASALEIRAPWNSMIFTPHGIAVAAKTPSPSIRDFFTSRGYFAFLILRMAN
jgi:hypothetical protein